MAEMGYAYAPLVKFDDNGDGTLTVYGKATDETLDVDQQICDNDWLKSAMPDWFTSAGNIREMHGGIAAGTATEYEEKSDGHYIRANIVDEGSVKKIKHGVLKGFSIGIRSPRVVRDQKAAGGRIVGGQIVEISVVDRPANPAAKMTIAKAMNGEALMAVEQFSIPTPADVANTAWAAKSLDVEVSAEPEVDAVEAVEPAVVETPDADDVLVEEVPVDQPEVSAETQIVEAAKSLIGILNKFDQGAYDAAMGAVADLIVVEANEMKQGSDERDSIKELLRAAKHLACWYQGEVEAGEVPGVAPEAADYTDSDDDGMYLAADKSVTVDDAQIQDIINKAVASAKAAVTDEIASLKSALEAEQGKASKLESDLEAALSKTVAGGPKRTTENSAPTVSNDLLAKAADYRAKARVANDPLLAQGYRELADSLESKAKKGN